MGETPLLCVAGNIGDTLHLLQDGVLPLCNAQQLAQIEDETREGGREIAADLSPHWQRVAVEDYGLPADDVEVWA